MRMEWDADWAEAPKWNFFQGSWRTGAFHKPRVLHPHLGQLSHKLGHLFQKEKMYFIWSHNGLPWEKKKKELYVRQIWLRLDSTSLKWKFPPNIDSSYNNNENPAIRHSACWRRNLKDYSCLVCEVTQTRNALYVLQGANSSWEQSPSLPGQNTATYGHSEWPTLILPLSPPFSFPSTIHLLVLSLHTISYAQYMHI